MDHLFLNWADPKNLRENVALLSTTQQGLLNTYEYKRAAHPGTKYGLSFACKYYENNVPIFIMADPSWAKAVTFCFEPVPSLNYARCFCQQRKSCVTCARFKASEKSKKLKNAFNSGFRAYFLTLSFKKNLFVTPDTKREDIVGWWEYVKEYQAKLTFIKGAFNVDEIAVQNLTERVVLPHTHCLILTDREDLCFETTTYDGKTRYTINQELFPLDPNLVAYIEPVLDDESFKHHIVYMIKAIDYHERYDIEWSEENAMKLNNSTGFLINHLTSQLKGNIQITTTGIMNARSKLYVGS